MPRRLAVGIDPAKHVHGVVAVLYPDRVVLEEQVLHDLSAMQALDARLERLAARHEAELVYGIEDHRGYGEAWLAVLQARGRQVRVVNPLWTHRQKDFYGQDKANLIDARAIAAVVLRKADQLPDATEASIDAATLREAARMLEDLAHQKTRALNRLTSCSPPHICPATKRFSASSIGPGRCGSSSVSPCPSTSTSCPSTSWPPFCWSSALDATAAVRQQPVTPALLLRAELIRQLCQELLSYHERSLRLKRLLEDELLPRTGQHLSTLPGVGSVLAATVLGEVGDIRRFPSRHAFAKYNGTAPASRSSGGKERHTARKSCSHRLKRAMWLMALAAVRHDPLARAYYERCRQRGLRPVEAIKRVARRMSDIVYAMLRERKPYDPARVHASMAARHQRQVPGTDGTPLVFREPRRLARPGKVTIPRGSS